jgi:hypothetical protein
MNDPILLCTLQGSDGGQLAEIKRLLLKMLKEEEDFLTDLLDDDDDDEFILGMCQYSIHIDKYLNRAEYRTPKVSGLEWVLTNLQSEKDSYNMFRMTPQCS